MMTRAQLLLTLLMEECSEIIKNASKTQRFGASEIYKGPENPKGLTNAGRIVDEFEDMLVVIDMLREEGVIELESITYIEKRKTKRAKVEHYIHYSIAQGQVQPKASP